MLALSLNNGNQIYVSRYPSGNHIPSNDDYMLKKANLQLACMGENHSLLVIDNELYSFGSNLSGQLGLEKNISRTNIPTNTKFYEKYQEKIFLISVGINHSIVVTQVIEKNIPRYGLYSFGYGLHGELCNGSSTYACNIPTKVANYNHKFKTAIVCDHLTIILVDNTIYINGQTMKTQYFTTTPLVLTHTFDDEIKFIDISHRKEHLSLEDKYIIAINKYCDKIYMLSFYVSCWNNVITKNQHVIFNKINNIISIKCAYNDIYILDCYGNLQLYCQTNTTLVSKTLNQKINKNIKKINKICNRYDETLAVLTENNMLYTLDNEQGNIYLKDIKNIYDMPDNKINQRCIWLPLEDDLESGKYVEYRDDRCAIIICACLLSVNTKFLYIDDIYFEIMSYFYD